MYQEYGPAEVRDLLGITEHDTPSGIVLQGVYDLPSHVRRWRDRLSQARSALKAFNIVIGNCAGQTLWAVPVLGAPMAAFCLHAACVLGVRRVVQIGSFGGTRRNLRVGDLLVVTGAGRGEAASDWYLPEDAPAQPDPELTDQLRDLLRERGLSWHEGAVYTTPAFMAETQEDILRWEREGYAGVEMEAATTFAVTQRFGVASACLIYLLDNLVAGHHVLSATAQERELLSARKLLVEDLALELLAR